MRRAAAVVFVAFGLAAALAVYVWPAATAVFETIRSADWQAAGLSERRLGLLTRGIAIALGAAALAQCLGAGLALGLGSSRQWLRRWAGWLCLIVFLMPPYIYSYAWSWLLVPAGVVTSQTFSSPAWAGVTTVGRAVFCLATWCAPVAAFVLARGWRLHGEAALTMLQLHRSPLAAFCDAARTTLRPWLAVSFIATFGLCVTEFSVCHLCLVQTWNTEILAEAQLFQQPGRVLLLAWPLLALVSLTAVVAWPWRERFRELLADIGTLADDAADAGGRPMPVARGVQGIVFVATVAVVLAPLGILISSLHSATPLLSTWRSFPSEWPLGLLAAAMSAALAASIALGCECLRGHAAGRWIAGGVFAIAVVAAVSPPIMIGDAVSAAYQRFNPVRDHLVIVAIAGAARFGVLLLLLVRLRTRSLSAQLGEQASVDRADALERFTSVTLPLLLPSVAAGGALVAMLALGEVAATQVVAPPGMRSVALTLLNAIHFGRDDQVIAMCIYMFAVASVFSLIIVGISLRRR